jgi:hypothetical protein
VRRKDIKKDNRGWHYAVGALEVWVTLFDGSSADV